MSGPLGRQVGQLAARSVRRTFRQPALLAPSLLFPLFLLAVNAGGLDAATRVPGFPDTSYLSFALAITFMQGALLATTAAGTNVAEDVRTGFLTRLSLTPLRGVALLAGELAGATLLALLQSGTAIAVGLAAGATVRSGAPGVVAVIALTVLITNAFAAVGVFWALRVGSGEAVQALFPLLFVAFFLSSMFLPRELITTTWFRAVATANPLSYMIEGLRSLIVSGWDAQALGLALACTAVLLAAALGGAVRALGTRMAPR